MAGRRVPEHVVQNAIVLDDVKLLYVPVPRAGSTAILWALAESVGLPEERFFGSAKLEVTRALTIHDLSFWGDEHRLVGRDTRAREEILGSDEWMRFTVVREPVRRVWSAWVTKILLRDPRFVVAFGAEEWFPLDIETADDVVNAFRRFVAVLSERPAEWHDPHWSAQAALAGIGALGYAVVGRMEELPDGLARIDEHLRAQGRAPLSPRRENVSLLPFAAGLLDAPTAGSLARWTAHDREVLGYPEVHAADGPDHAWHNAVEAALPAVGAVAERNERIGDLRGLLRRSRAS